MLFGKIRKFFGPNKEKERVFRGSGVRTLLDSIFLFYWCLLVVHVFSFTSTFFSFLQDTSLGFTFSFALHFSSFLLSIFQHCPLPFLWLSLTVWGHFLLSLVPFVYNIKLYKPYFYETCFSLQESLPFSWPFGSPGTISPPYWTRFT